MAAEPDAPVARDLLQPDRMAPIDHGSPDSMPEAGIVDCVPGCNGDLLCRAGRCVTRCEAAELDQTHVGCTFVSATVGLFSGFQNSYYSYDLVLINPDASRTAEVIVDVTQEVWRPRVARVAPLSVEVVGLQDGATGSGQGMLRFSVTSDQPIIAQQIASIRFNANAETGALLLPSATPGGRRHLVVARPQTVRPYAARLVVAQAGDAPVEVEISLTAAIEAGFAVPEIAAGSVYRATLAVGDFLKLSTRDEGGDLTGTIIESSAPVAVFAGNWAANVPSGFCDSGRCTLAPEVACERAEDCHAAGVFVCCADALEERMFPTALLADTYVAAASRPERQVDYWRIVALDDQTEVRTVPEQIEPRILGAGEWIEFSSGEDFEIFASQPVSVVQFVASEPVEAPAPRGSPAMSQAVPTARFLRRYTTYIPDGPEGEGPAQRRVVITAPRGAEVAVNGQAVEGWADVGEGIWQVARVDVAIALVVVEADRAIGVTSFIWTETSAAAWPAGLSTAPTEPAKSR